MNIAGIMVCAQPQHLNDVEQKLQTLKGVEVHASNESGRLVVTLEAEQTHQLADLLEQINHFPGVMTASMVYHGIAD